MGLRQTRSAPGQSPPGRVYSGLSCRLGAACGFFFFQMRRRSGREVAVGFWVDCVSEAAAACCASRLLMSRGSGRARSGVGQPEFGRVPGAGGCLPHAGRGFPRCSGCQLCPGAALPFHPFPCCLAPLPERAPRLQSKSVFSPTPGAGRSLPRPGQGSGGGPGPPPGGAGARRGGSGRFPRPLPGLAVPSSGRSCPCSGAPAARLPPAPLGAGAGAPLPARYRRSPAQLPGVEPAG